MESSAGKDLGAQNGARFAAIDLGTNSCRLLIATPNHRAIKVVYAFSRMVRLGEDLERTGQISPEAMERTVASLKLCASKMREYNVTRYCAVATAACRMASNSQELIDWIKAEAGLDVRIIDDAQEAELSLLGCAALLQPTIPYAIVFDIGGGSTEVMWVDNRYPGKPKIIDYVSVPLGVISDTLAEGQSAQALKTMGRMLQTLSQAYDIPRHMAEGQVQMIGTSGTVTTLAAIDMGLTKYDRGTIDGISVDATKLIQVVERLYGMTERERSNHPCIGPTRVDLILPGAAIFRCIHDCWPIKELSIADRGVREGILMQMFDQGSSIGERLVVYQRG